MRKLAGAIGILAVLVFAIALLADSEEAPEGPVAAAEDQPDAEPVEAEPTAGVTPEEQAWLDELGEATETVGDALGEIGDLATDDETRVLLLLGDQETVIRAAVQVAVLQQCSTLVKQAGPAPTRRLRNIRKPVLNACRHYEAAGTKFARGIDDKDPDLIVDAAREMGKGSVFIERATSRIAALRDG